MARRDVPTCGLHERVREVRERVSGAGWDGCVVVNDERVVLGLLRSEQLSAGHEDEEVERVMLAGPSTFRPYVSIEEMAHYMLEHDLDPHPSRPPTDAWWAC